jgi:spore coat polysaccharide biosynthesis predicted glycosyltransferase SpsG
MLILLGGIDANNVTAKAMRAVARVPQRSFEVDVIVGAEHPSVGAVRAACADLGYRCHVQPANVAALMMSADIAIGGCGTNSWERCCLGVPAIGMALAGNQAAIAQGLAAAGAIVDLGDAARVTEQDVLTALLDLLRDPERLRKLSAAALALVDGKGARRVRDFMVSAR